MLTGYKKIINLLLITVLISGCSNTVTSESAFLQWMNNPKNGYVKSTSANGFLLTLKYLPSEYLTHLESKKTIAENHGEASSKEFENSMTWLFSIEHENEGINVTNYGVQNMPDYKKRINLLNFELKGHLFIKGKEGKKIGPVLATFENSYELGGKKTFYVVFPKTEVEKLSEEVVDIVFDDPFLETGISHFVFENEKINHLPTLQFLN